MIRRLWRWWVLNDSDRPVMLHGPFVRRIKILYFFMALALVVGLWATWENRAKLAEQVRHQRATLLELRSAEARADLQSRAAVLSACIYFGGKLKDCRLLANGTLLPVKLSKGQTLKLEKILVPPGRPGEAGALGPRGLHGLIGPRGAKGPTGAAGHDGHYGKTGAMGVQGPPGARGPVGPAGSAGRNGANGAPGPAGARGPTGPAGAGGDCIWKLIHIPSQGDFMICTK
jgi:hypothetical protein